MKISASILNCNFLKLEEEISKIKPFTNMIHFDVMDGHFVNNLSFGQPIINLFKDDKSIIKDVHIMIDNPLKKYKNYTSLGIDYLTFHYEALSNDDEVFKLISLIRQENVKVGLSIKPETDVLKIKKFLPLIDLVLLMSVEPGQGGQKFMNNVLSKVVFLNVYRQTHDNMNYLIEADGGINDTNSKLLKGLGLDIAVVGSYLFKSDDIKASFEKLNG